MDYYILAYNKPFRVHKDEWAKWMQSADRNIRTTIEDGYLVSTVFLGMDHQCGQSGPPMLFETMVFEKGDWSDLRCERCSTYEEAIAQHERVCEEFFLEKNARDTEALLARARELVADMEVNLDKPLREEDE